VFRTSDGYIGVTYRVITPRDKIIVLLGCPLPVILREQPNGQHLFVGTAIVHGIMDGEALLVPLPDGWRVIVGYDQYHYMHQRFVDPSTKSSTRWDPRLPPLSLQWRPVSAIDPLWPNKTVQAFQDTTTEEISYSDPRMLPDALGARGVLLEKLEMI
jgi:hypothetical protein